ncbi:MAG: TIGR00289 family protein, partial [Candidatus Aenigmatarchaeota archaeon]
LLSIAPLWHRDPVEYLHAALHDNFEIIIVGVAAPPLDAKWLGRKIDHQCIDDLIALNKKHGISTVGEGGEFESLVLDCPLFLKKIEVVKAETNWNEKERSGTFDIKEIKLVDK